MGVSRAAIYALGVAAILGNAAKAQQADNPQAGDQQAQSTKPAGSDEEIVVFGRSQTRDSQVVNQIDIVQAAPGTSPLAVLNKLPGVNFQSADPYGAYEWSARITIRGFDQIQLGFTLDDIPLGDMLYWNFNGLHISRAIINENIGRTILSEGAGALGTASSSNLGGTLQFYSIDPSDEFGGTIAQGFGSDSARRSFIRLESGLLPSDTKFYVSYVNQDSDKWKGVGEQRQQQANGKLVQKIGEDSQFSAFLNYSSRQEIDYQDMSKNYLSKLGYNWDNYYPSWQAALSAAAHNYPFDKNGVVDPYDAAIYAGSGLRNDVLTGGTLDAALTDNIRAKVTAYDHSDDGRGLTFTPYLPSFTPGFTKELAPISTRGTTYQIGRTGVLASVTAELFGNKLTGGMWYESNGFNNASEFYANTIAGAISPYDFPSNPFFTQWHYRFQTDTLQFYLQDTVDLTDALTTSFGFKSLSVKSTGVTLAGPNENGSIEATDNFLPQFGATYSISNDQELFFNFNQNMRAFEAVAIGISPWAVLDSSTFASSIKTLKPEESSTYEAGWRFRNDILEAAATVYHIDFFNRLLAVHPCNASADCGVTLGNVGTVETNGVEAQLSAHPIEYWNWLNSVSFNDSNYGSDYYDGGQLVPTKGKEVVDSPKWMLKTDLSYDDGNLFGSVDGKYFAKRYYTYVNDNYAGSYAIFNFALGYRIIEPFAHVREIDFRVNVDNLLDRRYIATVGSTGFVASDPTGTAQTLLPGAPRTAFANVTAKF